MSQLFGMGTYNKINTESYEAPKTSKAANTKNTVGNPKLSEAASSYYEELKAKHKDVEFVLVSNDKIDVAKEYTSNLVTDKSMIVLISEDEVEQMTIDENVRAQNEKLITDAKAQMPDLMKQLKESGTEVKSFGMEFNDDGTASYFAVVDKSIAAQKERIEKNLEEKRAEKKENVKETPSANASLNASGKGNKKDLVTVSASSMDELIKKIKDVYYTAKADTVLTAQEKMVGQSFDLTV